MRICSRINCTAAAYRRRGNAHYCVAHVRMSGMRATSKARGKTIPTWEELEALRLQGMTCKPCGREMNWLASDGQDTVLSLQHDRSGAFRFLCRSCNTRHAVCPDDSFYQIPKDHKRCSGCEQVKHEDKFYAAASGRYRNKKGYCKACSDAKIQGWRDRNKDAYNAYMRSWRAKRKDAAGVSA